MFDGDRHRHVKGGEDWKLIYGPKKARSPAKHRICGRYMGTCGDNGRGMHVVEVDKGMMQRKKIDRVDIGHNETWGKATCWYGEKKHDSISAKTATQVNGEA